MPKTQKIDGGKGVSDDLLIIEGDISTSVKSGKGSDLIRDLGGNEDKVKAGDGDDTVEFHYSGNESGINEYDGDKGSDTLALHFTRAQWLQLNALVQTDLDSFLAHLVGGSKKGFQFQSVGIEAGEFETVRVFVDDLELSPEDDVAIATDDDRQLDENTEIIGNVLDNDEVPDLVRQVERLGADVSRGALSLNSDGSFTFVTGTDFEELALDEPATVSFSYRVTDATGDTDDAVVTIVVNGQNDTPLLDGTDAEIVEDGPAVVIDLSALASDIDSDDDGSTLSYTVSTPPSAGLASIVGTDLLLQGGDDFQSLAADETTEVIAGITATDRHGASVSNTVQVTVLGTNDLPVLMADQLEVVEDGSVLFDVLANDSDIDATDILQLTAVQGASYGIVKLVDGDDADDLANDMLIYTPNADFSGTDSFTYTVSDGNGGVVSQTATVSIAARADAPSVSQEVLAGATATQFTLRVSAQQQDLDGSEFIDRIELSGRSADGSTFDLSPYVNNTVWQATQANDSVTADFVFNLPAGSNNDFDIIATAVSKEPSNGDEASAETSLALNTSGSSVAQRYTFNAQDQSIWSNGDAFNYNSTIYMGGTLEEDAEIGASIIGPIDIRVAGTGATTHFSTVVRTDVDLNLGMESRIGVQGGSVDATLNYNTDVTATFNRTTDVLTISTSASNHLLENGFSASTPNINFEQALTNFSLDMSFGLYLWGYLHLHYTAGTQHIVHWPNIWNGPSISSPDIGIDLGGLFGPDGLSLLEYDGNALRLLEGLYTQTEYSGTKSDAWGNELYSWLFNSHAFTNNSDNANWWANQVTGSESRDFATLRFDLDGIVAHLRQQPNPVHQELDTIDVGPLYLTAGAELLDIDLVLRSSYRQDNFLQPGQLNGTLVFEDDSQIDFVFGEVLNISNASQRDANGDGQIDFHFVMRPDAQFQTNAYIDLSLMDEVDVMSANIAGGLEGFGSVGLDEGPVKEWNGTVINQHVPIQLVGNSFSLDVATVESQIIVI